MWRLFGNGDHGPRLIPANRLRLGALAGIALMAAAATGIVTFAFPSVANVAGPALAAAIAAQRISARLLDSRKVGGSRRPRPDSPNDGDKLG
jgi:hypothetical protein